MPKDAPRLYLITPPISDWAPYPLLFEAAMATCDVACVLLRIAAHEEDEKDKIVRVLAPLVQRHGVACLGDAVFADPRGAAAALRDAARLMAPTPEAAE